ncbi:MAG: hypothetical protein SGJ05_05830 [bacterium]|nr:hypothetical protein [bacterium]
MKSPTSSTLIRGAFTDRISVQNLTNTSRGSSDGFLLNVDDELRPLWLNTYGGPGYDAITCMAPLPDGGLVVGMICGSGVDGITVYTIGNTTFTGRGNSDAVVFVVNADGTLRWARNDGAFNAEYPTFLTVVNDTLIVVAGVFVKQSRFGTQTVTDSAEISGYVQAIDMSGNHRWVQVIRGKGLEGGSLAVQIDVLHVSATSNGRIDIVARTSETLSWGDSTLYVDPFFQSRPVVTLSADLEGNALAIGTAASCLPESTAFAKMNDTLCSASAEFANTPCVYSVFDIIGFRWPVSITQPVRIPVQLPQVHAMRQGLQGPLISGETTSVPLVLALDGQGKELWRYTLGSFDNGSMYDAVQTDTSVIAVALARSEQFLPLFLPVNPASLVVLLLQHPITGVNDENRESQYGAIANPVNRIVYYDEVRHLLSNGYTLTSLTGAQLCSPLQQPLTTQVCILSSPLHESVVVLLLP